MGLDLAMGSEMVVSWNDVKVSVGETAGGISVFHDCTEGKPAILICLGVGPIMGKRWSRVILKCFNHYDDLRRWVAFKAEKYKGATIFEITHEGMIPLEVKAK